MSTRSVLICLPDDRDATGLSLPLMLQNLTGAPLLAWMVRLMRDSGYARFGLCCPEEFQEKAGAEMSQTPGIRTTLTRHTAIFAKAFLRF